MYIPSGMMNQASSRYSQGYGVPTNRNVRLAGSCCPTKSCGCGRGYGCGCAQAQQRSAMMPNIVINVQSGNRRSNDYTDAHNASTSYSPQSSENNPYLFAPTNTEQNPYFTSYKHGGNYGSRYVVPETETTTAKVTETEVVPMILSPRAAQKKAQASEFDPGVRPEYVGRRYPLEFP